MANPLPNDIREDISRLKDGVSWERGVTLPLYFGFEVRIILRRITDLRKHIVGPFKTYRGYLGAVALCVIAASGWFYFSRFILTQAATYTWVQTDWSGGVTVNNANHTSNRTGWTEYSAETAATAGATVVIDTAEGVDWWDTDWTERKKITFNNAGSAENLTSFPVMIGLSAAAGNIDYASTQSAGEDIRFVDSDNATVLDYEIEKWDETATSTVWVEVPQIDAGSTTDFIYMYYGNGAAVDAQDITGTWNANYIGVWHLNETSGAHEDSTSNNIDSATIDVQLQGTATGKNDGADDFEASSSDGVRISENAALDINTDITFSAWIRQESQPASSQTIIGLDQRGIWFDAFGDELFIGTSYNSTGSYDECRTSASNLSTSDFSRVTGVFDGSNNQIKLYVNGALAASSGTYGNGCAPTSDPIAFDDLGDVGIGVANQSTDTEFFDGIIDESRVSNVARSADWIEAEYLSEYGSFATYADDPMVMSGNLTSSPFNAENSENLLASIAWSETLPAGSDVKFQIRTAPNSAGSPGTWTDWLGPTSTGDYYTNPAGAETINSTHTDGSNDQWIQYKVFLSGTDTSPTLSDITLTYVVNAPPDFQSAATASQSADGTVAISYYIRDTDGSSGSGVVTPSFQYSTDNGSSWNNVTTGLSANATSTKDVDDSSYTNYTATWTAKTQIDGTYETDFKMRVTVDDGEAANNTASSDSIAFTLDVKDPVLGSPALFVVGTTTPATLGLSATDNSTLQMQISLNSDFSGASWEDYSAASTKTLATDPDTVYARFRDTLGNVTATQSATTPETPVYPIIRDVTNVNDPPTYQLFVSWRAVAEPSPGFGQYAIWRSTDGVTETLLTTIADRSQNYYLNSGLSEDVSYYYRVSVLDDNGNASGYSSQVVDTPDGQGGTDATPPTISNVRGTSTTTQSIIITWDTDELSNSTVGYSTSAATFTTEVGVATMVNTEAGVGQHSVALTGLTPGTTYYYQLTSEDPESNSVSANNGGDGYTFTTTSGPSISGTAVSNVKNTQATIVWTTSSAAASAVYYSTSATMAGAQSVSDATESTDHVQTITGLTTGTKYYFYVVSGVASDTNGGSYYSFTTTQDTVAPVITSVDESPIGDTYALIIWTTNEAATSKVAYGTSSGTYPSSTEVSSLDTSHAVNLSSLTAATPYYYVAVSADGSGNTSTSTEATFTTRSALSTEEEVAARETIARQQGAATSGGGGGGATDSVKPNILNVVVGEITGTSAQFTWTTNEDANSFVQFGRTSLEGYEEIDGELQFGRTHTVVARDLRPGTQYRYRAISADRAGNITEAPDATFTTLGADGSVLPDLPIDGPADSQLSQTLQATSDLISALASQVSLATLESSLLLQNNLIRELSSRLPTPLISGEPRVEVTATTAVISWTTDKESNSLVALASEDEYLANADEPYQQVIGDSDASTTRHRVSLGNLTPDTLYHYEVRSRTAVSGYSQSDDFTFRTSRTSLEISNYTIEVESDTSVIFRWTTNSAADSIVRYIPYRNGTAAIEEARIKTSDALTTIHQVDVSDFEAGVLYDVELISEDTGGTVATRAIDAFSTNDENQAPIITQIKTDAALAPGDTPKIQAIISWITNESSSTKVYYQRGIASANDTFEEETPLDANYTKRHVVVLTNLEPGTVYQFRVESTDATGLTVTSGTHTILTPRERQSVFQLIVTNFEETFGWLQLLRP